MAVELGAGYVSLSVRYAEGMRKAAEGIAHEAEKAGEKAGKAIGEKVTKELPKAINTRPMEQKIEDARKRYEKKLQAKKPKINVDVIVEGPGNTAAERAKIEEAARRYEEKFARRKPKVPVDVHYEIPPAEVEAAKRRHREETDANAEYSKRKNKEVAADQKQQTTQTTQAQKSAWGEVFDEIRTNADALGIDLDKVLSDAAARAGKNIGKAIGGSQIGQKVIDAFESVTGEVEKFGEQTGIDFGRVFADALSGKLDTEALFRDIMSEAGPLGGIAGGDFAKSFNEIVTQMPGMEEILKDFPGAAGKKGGEAGDVFTKAFEGVTITGMLTVISELEKMVDDMVARVPERFAGLPAREMVGQATQEIERGAVLGPAAPLVGLSERLPGPQQQWMRRSREWWRTNKPSFVPSFGLQHGGIAGRTPAGRLYGPGSGVSDSILGMAAGGMPAVRVSAGEGIVKELAMRHGGADIVAALNRYQRGGVIDKATAFAQSQSGKPYSYGGTSSATSWDCSGFMGALYAIFTGKPYDGPRYFNTESNFEALGFKPGFMPGAFNIGIMRGGGGPNSHMGGTLPTGVAVESSGSNGVQYGGKAKGAQTFPLKYYLPIGGDPRTGQYRMPAYGGGGGGGGGRGFRGGGGVAGGGGDGGFGGGGGGGGVPLMPGPGGTWTSPNAAWAALIKRESGGRADIVQQIIDANTGGNEASGLFQIAKGTWAGAGGGAFAATAGEASPAQQAEIAAKIFRAQGGGPWGAGLPGRENAAELAAGLDDVGGGFDDVTGYMGDFGDEIGTKTSDLGAFDTSLNAATGTIDQATGGAGPGGEGSGIQMLGELADIAQAGVKETFLPPGFSDPQSWPVMKSIGAFMGFMGGKIGGPGGSVLSGIGAGVSGSPSGMMSAIAGIRPQAFGNLEPGSPGLAPDDFTAMGSAQGASLAAGFVDAAQGFIPDVQQQPQTVDNSIHVGENGTVGQDPTAVRDGIRRDQMTQTRGMAATSRTTF